MGCIRFGIRNIQHLRYNRSHGFVSTSFLIIPVIIEEGKLHTPTRSQVHPEPGTAHRQSPTGSIRCPDAPTITLHEQPGALCIVRYRAGTSLTIEQHNTFPTKGQVLISNFFLISLTSISAALMQNIRV